MASARIIDTTGRTGGWTDALKEVLTSSGFGLNDPGDDSTGLTILLHSNGAGEHEERYTGDLLVLSIPGGSGADPREPSRTEVIGSNRLKARHRLSQLGTTPAIADEIRPLVKLFLH